MQTYWYVVRHNNGQVSIITAGGTGGGGNFMAWQISVTRQGRQWGRCSHPGEFNSISRTVQPSNGADRPLPMGEPIDNGAEGATWLSARNSGSMDITGKLSRHRQYRELNRLAGIVPTAALRIVEC